MDFIADYWQQILVAVIGGLIVWFVAWRVGPRKTGGKNPKQSAPQTAKDVGGDVVFGDKVGRDKIGGDNVSGDKVVKK